MLRALHPLAKLCVCLSWIAAASLVMDARLQVAIIGLAVALLTLVDRTPLWIVLAAAAPFALFGFGFLTTAILFRTDGGYVAQLSGESALRSDAARAGVTLFLRAIACGMASFLFVRVTDPGALVRALMANARLSPRIGYALFAMMNAAPMILEDLRAMRIARAMRKGQAPRRAPGLREALSLVTPLLAGAIRRASWTAVAMEARGLARGGAPTIMDAPRWRRRDTLTCALGSWAPLVALAF